MDEANAQLLRVDVGAVTGTGGVVWTEGSALAIDCALDVPQSRHKYSLGARITDATAVVYLEDRDLDAATRAKLLAPGARIRLQVQPAGRAAALWESVAIVDRVDADLGHFEIFVKGAAA